MPQPRHGKRFLARLQIEHHANVSELRGIALTRVDLTKGTPPRVGSEERLQPGDGILGNVRWIGMCLQQAIIWRLYLGCP